MKFTYRFNLLLPDQFRIPMVILLIVLADILFYRSETSSIGSVPFLIFYLLLLIFSLPHHLDFMPLNFRLLWGFVFFLCGLGLLYSVNFYSIALPLFALYSFRMVSRGTGWETRAGKWLRDLLLLACSVLFDWYYQIRVALEKVGTSRPLLIRFMRGAFLWFLPVLFTLLFLLLFASANPIIDRGLGNVIEFCRKIELPRLSRLFFWFCVFLFTTSLSGLTLWKRFREIWDSNLAVCTYQVELGKSTDDLLARIMTRALILFNLLFLLQNVLDIEYLWSGAALPAGMSYAEYAHRGAYPLILTALLAGLLTLIAFRRQSTGAGWKWARILVYVWLLQNVFLVASSLLRLGKYIAVYSLTELRVAAGLWMLLVACGLCLILRKIWKNRSLNWLVWTNGAALLVLLLFVMLCDIRGHIAEYNLAHCREAVPVTKEGLRPVPLDVPYLCSLGYPALPALLKAEEKGIEIPPTEYGEDRIQELYLQLGKDLNQWRTFTLHRYLVQKKAEPLYTKAGK